jgi:hypothetical protein
VVKKEVFEWIRTGQKSIELRNSMKEGNRNSMQKLNLAEVTQILNAKKQPARGLAM